MISGAGVFIPTLNDASVQDTNCQNVLSYIFAINYVVIAASRLNKKIAIKTLLKTKVVKNRKNDLLFNSNDEKRHLNYCFRFQHDVNVK